MAGTKNRGKKGENAGLSLPNPALVNALKFLAVVYMMTILVFSIVFPLSFFIRGGAGNVNSTYLWVFLTYLAAVGIIFLLYLNIKIYQLKEKPTFDDEENVKSSTVYTISTSTDHGIQDINVFKEDVDIAREKQIVPDSHHNNKDLEDMSGQNNYHELEHAHKNNMKASLMMARAQAPIQHGGPGVNFFLRLGAIGFALGSMLLEALRIVVYFQTENRNDCYGPIYLVGCFTTLVFIAMETHFLFKHHKIIINFRHALMFFGMLHLISTNLVLWVAAVAIETYEGFHAIAEGHGSEGHGDGEHGSGEHGDNGHQRSTSHDVHKRETSEDLPCAYGGLHIFDAISPYLYPLVIEFALIAAAIVYKVVTNIGALVNKGYDDWEANHHTKKVHNNECHKATSGVMWGLLAFATIFAVTLAFMLSDDESLNSYLYLSGDLSLQVLAFVSCVFAFRKVSTLTFSGDVENPIDEYLIVICLAGLYFLTGARIVAASVDLSDNPEDKNTNILYIVTGVVTFIQASLQTVFIVDGFRREATTPKQQFEKPGRSLISFLLFCNLAMWLVNSFQLKETNQSSIMRDFFGDLAWIIILYLTLPLTVFFRFHSVVCLSDIWIEAYKKRCHALFKINPDQIHHGEDHGESKNINNEVVPNNIAIVESVSQPNYMAVNDLNTDSQDTKL